MVRLTGKHPLPFLSVLLLRYVHHHANEAHGLTILAIQAFTTDLDPARISIFWKQPVFLNVLLAGRKDVVDSVGYPLDVVGMYARDVLRQRSALFTLGRIDREHFREASIGKKSICLHMPIECAHHSRSVESLAQSLLGLSQRPFRSNTFRSFNDNSENASGTAVLIKHRAVIEIHPDLFWETFSVERKFLVAVRKRIPAHAHSHHVVVEGRDFGPALSHVRSEKSGVTFTCKVRVSIVVKHDPVLPP